MSACGRVLVSSTYNMDYNVGYEFSINDCRGYIQIGPERSK